MKRDVQNLYRPVIIPLAARGLTCTVEYGIATWIVQAELPDRSHLIISTAQEPLGNHLPGPPDAWIVHWIRESPPAHRLLYDSIPGGPDEAHRGQLPPLLRVLDTHLDRLGVPPRPASPPAPAPPPPTAHRSSPSRR